MKRHEHALIWLPYGLRFYSQKISRLAALRRNRKLRRQRIGLRWMQLHRARKAYVLHDDTWPVTKRTT